MHFFKNLTMKEVRKIVEQCGSIISTEHILAIGVKKFKQFLRLNNTEKLTKNYFKAGKNNKFLMLNVS